MNIYQENILDHYQHPRHAGKLKKQSHSSDVKNDLCGDDLQFELLIDKGVVKDAAFTGIGCVISKSAADILIDEIIGKKVSEVKKLTSDDLVKMLGIPISPTRLKCALISLEGVSKAI